MRVVEPDEKHILKDKRINVLTYSMLIQVHRLLCHQITYEAMNTRYKCYWSQELQLQCLLFNSQALFQVLELHGLT